MGLYSLTSIANDAKYDLTANVDVTDGLTNGAECVIKNIDLTGWKTLADLVLYGYYFQILT